jgi:protocatechuate 3,4-dioxygenase beta subunit
MKRRTYLKICTAASLAPLIGCTSGSIKTPELPGTYTLSPKMTEGPYYPVTPQKEKDFDLTQLKGNKGKAKGEAIFVQGRIFDTKGNSLENITVDLWQCNADGRYSHPRDKSKNPIDPDFQGWAIVPSGAKGEFNFKTIYPGNYGRRTPHIHFKFLKGKKELLTTQLFFPDEKLNQKDSIYRRTGKSIDLLTSKYLGKKSGLRVFQFDVVL